MSMRRAPGLLLLLACGVAPTRLPAQAATGTVAALSPAMPGTLRFQHRKKLVAIYDTVADSTHLAVVTHKGKYFLTIQRPRLTWTVSYPGRRPDTLPPAEIVLEFRTQAPQVPRDSHLLIVSASGERLEAASVGAFSDPGMQTWSAREKSKLASARS